MIMKKLYTRNKDLETAVDKAQNKIKEVKRNTTQNFFKNPPKQEDESLQAKTENDENKEEIQDFEGEGNDDESDIEIGCKECDKYREKEKKLNQDLEKKIKYISELEKKVS